MSVLSLQAAGSTVLKIYPHFFFELDSLERDPGVVTVEEGVSTEQNLCPVAMLCLNQRMSMCMWLCVHGMCRACAVITRITV